MFDKSTYQMINKVSIKCSNYFSIIIITALLFSIYFYTSAYGNSAEPPGFTIVVTNPPKDLTLSLKLPDDDLTEPIILDSGKKAWESYYRFYYNMSPGNRNNLADTVLIVQSSDKSFQCSFPASAFARYNNLLTLNMDTESLSMGQSPFRVPFLVALRVLLTLFIEGIIFFLFGYRQKRSWIVFLAINLITQGGLNVMLTGSGLGPYWRIGFMFGEAVVLIVEIATFLAFIKEFRKRRAVLCAIAANASSLVIGGLMITHLPV